MNGPISREVLSLVCSSVDPDDWITLFCDEKIYNPEEQDKQQAETAATGIPRNPFSLFRTMKPSQPQTPVARKDDLTSRKDLVGHLEQIFIVEGYTPNPSLKTVRELIERLKTSQEIVRVDLRSDDQVLAPTGIPELEAEQIPDFRRFVIEIEVHRP
jgi:hypothetical protein